LNQLLKLEEERVEALKKICQRQQNVKKYFDQSATIKNFQKGELVLLWNKEKENPSMHTKFEALWIGLYIIEKISKFQFIYAQGHEGNNINVSSQWETSEKFLCLIFILFTCT
jgi:hypothetical protein